MYLSRLNLNLNNQYAKKDLSLGYEMHKTLSRAFCDPSLTDEQNAQRLQDARILFRSQNNIVLVQSHIKPDWSQISKSYFVVEPEVKEFDYSGKLRAGQQYTFALVALPSKKMIDTGKRTFLRDQQDQLNWLHRKASEHGFEILNVEHNIIGRAYRNGNKTSTVTAPLFKGVLTIKDPIKVLDAIENGIGPQKHRGFGLLSILR